MLLVVASFENQLAAGTFRVLSKFESRYAINNMYDEVQFDSFVEYVNGVVAQAKQFNARVVCVFVDKQSYNLVQKINIQAHVRILYINKTQTISANYSMEKSARDIIIHYTQQCRCVMPHISLVEEADGMINLNRVT